MLERLQRTRAMFSSEKLAQNARRQKEWMLKLSKFASGRHGSAAAAAFVPIRPASASATRRAADLDDGPNNKQTSDQYQTSARPASARFGTGPPAQSFGLPPPRPGTAGALSSRSDALNAAAGGGGGGMPLGETRGRRDELRAEVAAARAAMPPSPYASSAMPSPYAVSANRPESIRRRPASAAAAAPSGGGSIAGGARAAAAALRPSNTARVPSRYTMDSAVPETSASSSYLQQSSIPTTIAPSSLSTLPSGHFPSYYMPTGAFPGYPSISMPAFHPSASGVSVYSSTPGEGGNYNNLNMSGGSGLNNSGLGASGLGNTSGLNTSLGASGLGGTGTMNAMNTTGGSIQGAGDSSYMSGVSIPGSGLPTPTGSTAGGAGLGSSSLNLNSSGVLLPGTFMGFFSNPTGGPPQYMMAMGPAGFPIAYMLPNTGAASSSGGGSGMGDTSFTSQSSAGSRNAFDNTNMNDASFQNAQNSSSSAMASASSTTPAFFSYATHTAETSRGVVNAAAAASAAANAAVAAAGRASEVRNIASQRVAPVAPTYALPVHAPIVGATNAFTGPAIVGANRGPAVGRKAVPAAAPNVTAPTPLSSSIRGSASISSTSASAASGGAHTSTTSLVSSSARAADVDAPLVRPGSSSARTRRPESAKGGRGGTTRPESAKGGRPTSTNRLHAALKAGGGGSGGGADNGGVVDGVTAASVSGGGEDPQLRGGAGGTSSSMGVSLGGAHSDVAVVSSPVGGVVNTLDTPSARPVSARPNSSNGRRVQFAGGGGGGATSAGVDPNALSGGFDVIELSSMPGGGGINNDAGAGTGLGTDARSPPISGSMSDDMDANFPIAPENLDAAALSFAMGLPSGGLDLSNLDCDASQDSFIQDDIAGDEDDGASNAVDVWSTAGQSKVIVGGGGTSGGALPIVQPETVLRTIS